MTRTWFTTQDPNRSVATASKIISERHRVAAHVLAGAAILYFASVDREEQVRAILAQPESGKAHVRSIEAQPEIIALIKSWNFRLFNVSTVTRAAIVRFIELPPDEVQDWIVEFYVFVGDTRTGK